MGPSIPDSSSAALAAQAREAGAEVLRLGIAPDDRGAHRRAARRRASPAADIVVASGGVSVGAHDEVRDAFDDVGRIDLWRVAIQPGKPLAFGRATRADGREVLLFGLPGNPVSSFVTFELFVRPVLRRLAGHRDLDGPCHRPSAARRTRRRSDPGPAGVPAGPSSRPIGGADPDRRASPAARGRTCCPASPRPNGLAIVPEEVGALRARERTWT